MATQKQIAANRRNAKKSTGPVTSEGKAASSMNACKTGLYAESLIIPGENAEDLETLTAEYYAYYKPGNPDFRDLVDDLVAAVWQIRRLFVTEAEMEKYNEASLYRGDQEEYPRGHVASASYKQLGALQRRLDSARRARDRARLAIREYLQNAAAIHAAIEAAHAAGRPAAAQGVPQPPAIPLTDKGLTENWLRSENLPSPAQPSPASGDPAPTEPLKAA